MKSYSLENSLRESIFREDLFIYNCLQAAGEAESCALLVELAAGETRAWKEVGNIWREIQIQMFQVQCATFKATAEKAAENAVARSKGETDALQGKCD